MENGQLQPDDHSKRQTRRSFYARIFDIVGVAFTIVALALAWKQYYDSAQLIRDLEHQSDSVKQIAGSVSTSYLNETFPEYFDVITKLISRSNVNDEIWILVDHVGHGHYSSPELYKDYVDAIKNTKAAHVHILVYGQDAATVALQVQFKNADDKLDLSEKHPYAKRFTDYFKYYQTEKQTDYWSFLNALIDQQNKFCQQLTAFPDKIEIRTLSEPSSLEAMWLWMVVGRDSKEAHEMIFASPSYADEEDKGLAFKTIDSNLLHVFSSRFNEKWKSAKPIVGKSDSPRSCFEKRLFPPPARLQRNGLSH